MATAANLPLHWEQVGIDDSGNPLFNVRLPDDEQDAELHVLLTGENASGLIKLPNGDHYNVTAPVVRVPSQQHAGLISHLIGVDHERRGLFGDGGGHVCDELCGELARPTTAADAYRGQQAALASGAAEAAASNGVTAITPYTNLHSASPGTTGANELGSTRQSTAWTTGTAGSPNPSNSGSLSYTLAASTTATHVGGWSAVSAGTYSVGFPLSPTVTTGTSAGTVTIAVGSLSLATT